MMSSTRRRTLISFAVLIGGMFLFIALWYRLQSQPLVDEAPRPFRTAMELNGKIWKRIFSAKRLNLATPPPKGKIPRVNGDIGLEGEFKPADWRLEVIADDTDTSAAHLVISIQDILALPRTDTATKFFCIEGWSGDMAFAGVKFSDFMKAYNLKGKRYVGLMTADEEYYVSIDIESMLHPQTLLAYEMNGEPLRPANGAPLRLVIPVKYGIKNIKRIGKIFFSDQRPPDYWAERGYDWYADL